MLFVDTLCMFPCGLDAIKVIDAMDKGRAREVIMMPKEYHVFNQGTKAKVTTHLLG